MRMILIVSCLVVFSCQTRKKKPSPEVIEKVDASQLKASVSAADYTKGKVSGVLLTTKLDPKASMVSYEACTLKSPPVCVQGKVDGLLPDAVFNIPNGEVQVTYQACVPPWKAIGALCGPTQTLAFNHIVKNQAPLYLALVASSNPSLEIRALGEEIHNALRASINSEHSSEIFKRNLLSVDPTILGRLLDSSSFEKFLGKVRSYDTRNSYTGAGLLALGSREAMLGFFQQWKDENDTHDTSAYVQSVEDAFSNFESLPHSENLQALVNAIASSSGSDRKLLNTLAGIESRTMILRRQMTP